MDSIRHTPESAVASTQIPDDGNRKSTVIQYVYKISVYAQLILPSYSLEHNTRSFSSCIIVAYHQV